MVCKCYRAERNFLGKVGVCFGTKERDPCSCGGDKRKCDFYPEKAITLDGRKVFKFMLDDEDAQIQVIKDAKKYGLAVMRLRTNADRIRAMSDEELATFLVQTMTCTACRDMHGGECPKPKDYKEKKCSDMILEWLKQETKE